MAERAIVEIVQRYLAALRKGGIRAQRAILFGSFARGTATEWSDIDVIVLAPEFDGRRSLGLVKRLWATTSQADVRIEPIACGVREWKTEEGRPILDIARREGVEIRLR